MKKNYSTPDVNIVMMDDNDLIATSEEQNPSNTEKLQEQNFIWD